jgi:hypothetical protein
VSQSRGNSALIQNNVKNDPGILALTESITNNPRLAKRVTYQRHG